MFLYFSQNNFLHFCFITLLLYIVAGKGLGIGVGTSGSIEQRNYGIFIKYIARGSATEKLGNLQ